jgi:alkyl hydroperoxide reductase subunit F
MGSEHQRLDPEGIFVQIGLLPNTEWLRDPLALSDRGEIVMVIQPGKSP